MQATINGRPIIYRETTIFTVEFSRNKRAYVKECEYVGNPFMACRLLRAEGRNIKRRLLINGTPVARHN